MEPSSHSTGGVGPDAEQQRVSVCRSGQEPPRAPITRSLGTSRLRLLPTVQELELRLLLAREWGVNERTWQQVDQSYNGSVVVVEDVRVVAGAKHGWAWHRVGGADSGSDAIERLPLRSAKRLLSGC